MARRPFLGSPLFWILLGLFVVNLAVVWVLLPPTKLGLQPHAVARGLDYEPLSERIATTDDTQAIVFRDEWYERRGSGWFVLLPPFEPDVLELEIGLKTTFLGDQSGRWRSCLGHTTPAKGYGRIPKNFGYGLSVTGEGRCWRRKMDLSQVIPVAIPAKRQRFESTDPAELRAKIQEVAENPHLLPYYTNYTDNGAAIQRTIQLPLLWHTEFMMLDNSIITDGVQIQSVTASKPWVRMEDSQRLPYARGPSFVVRRDGDDHNLTVTGLHLHKGTVTLICDEAAQDECAALTAKDILIDLDAQRDPALLKTALKNATPTEDAPDLPLPETPWADSPVELGPVEKIVRYVDYLELLEP